MKSQKLAQLEMELWKIPYKAGMKTANESHSIDEDEAERFYAKLSEIYREVRREGKSRKSSA